MRFEMLEDKLPADGFLTRLRRDKRGNVIAVMAMSLIPMSALAGSAVDMTRLYLVKSRLQQACDAGALAGRKFMKEGDGTALDSDAEKEAKNFFDNNFREGWMSTKLVNFTPAKTSSNRVTGTAAVTVPMSIMKMFAVRDVRLAVTCEARLDIADTDIIFVLDTTGSMGCVPTDTTTNCANYAGVPANQVSFTRPTNSATNVTAGYGGTTGWRVVEKDGSRIDKLREAVVDFYTTMDAAKQPSTLVRYGFVPYTSTVNAGAAIMAVRPEYMLGGGSATETWDYESRRVTGDYRIREIDGTRTYNDKIETNCGFSVLSRTPEQTTPLTYDRSTGEARRTAQRWFTYAPNGNAMSPAKCGTAIEAIGPVWTYERMAHDVNAYVKSAGVQDPTKVKTNSAVWLGCIEERATSPKLTSFNLSDLPDDLDPDLIPSSASTRWPPLWPQVTYWRKNNTNFNRSSFRTSTMTTEGDTALALNLNSDDQLRNGNVSCNKPIQRLGVMTSEQVSGYVNANDFVPIGGTYHDTGMIWALRLYSRTGIFAEDNATKPNRNPAKRVIVFLTDGDMSPSEFLYGLYGMEFYNNRIAGDDYTNLKDYHNRRFLALCEKAKQQMGIDVWTVALGTGKTTELTSCASADDQALAPNPNDPTALSTAFKKIAKAVALLRVSK